MIELTEDDIKALEEKKKRKFDIFWFINGINDKEYFYCDFTKKIYNQYVINKAFSQNIDTIAVANYLNMNQCRNDKWHHDFLFHFISKKKRYGKWAKPEPYEDWVKDAAEYLQFSIPKTIEYINLLNDEDRANFRKMLFKGGVVK